MISERSALAGERVLFIDDVEADLAAAHSVGYVSRRHESAGGAAGPERLLRPPGLEIA